MTKINFSKEINKYGEFYSYADFGIQKLNQDSKYKVYRKWHDKNYALIGFSNTVSGAKKIIRTITNVD